MNKYINTYIIFVILNLEAVYDSSQPYNVTKSCDNSVRSKHLLLHAAYFFTYYFVFKHFNVL